MPKLKDIKEHRHAQRALEHDSWQAGKGGRPSKVNQIIEDEKQKEHFCWMVYRGYSPAFISRALHLSRNTVGEWLRTGEAALDVDPETDNPFAELYRLFWTAKDKAMDQALGRLFDSEDDKMVNQWISRTDHDMEFVDRDRVAGRSEVNIQQINRENVQVNLQEGLAMARARFQEQQEKLALGPATAKELSDGRDE